MPIEIGPDGERTCSKHGPITGANAHPRTSPRTGRPVVPNCVGCRSANGSRPRPGRRRAEARPVEECASWVEEYEHFLSFGMDRTEARLKLGVTAIHLATCYQVVQAAERAKTAARCARGHINCPRKCGPLLVKDFEGPKAHSCPWHVNTMSPKTRTKVGFHLGTGCFGCDRARTFAATAGNRTKHLFVDEVSVARAVASDPPKSMTRAERQEVVRILTDRGLSAYKIGVRLRIAQRTVTRLRARIKAASITNGV